LERSLVAALIHALQFQVKSVMTKTEARHPFGELLAQHRARKPGLTQTRLAELAGYNQAILVRMCQGKKDLTGPSGRERVVRLVETLADQGALTTLDEANALLLSADMPPLFERQPNEARLITRLSRVPAGQRTRRTNLPAPLTSFVGRANELAEVRRLLGLTRLLTLTGAGGSGKTRLAQRIAADVLIAYSEGVWYAELAVLTDSALIADAAVRALGLIASDRPALEQVMDYLRERHVLLVLDNCEHLIDAVAAFSIEVLRACPRVTILTTSREALNMDGETAWRVPPMQPDEAGRLFVDRALATRTDAHLSAGDETVAHICQRLDGMPLAIELAAARLNSLSLSDIAARLDDRFNLLAVGRRGALPRHQTLRALIDWSYDSLSEPEKIVFRRLGVFVGGWELGQAEEVVSDDEIASAQVFSVLMQLVDKSLVVMEVLEGTTRYRFLETLREYALAKLQDHDELEQRQSTHAHMMGRWSERMEWQLRSNAPASLRRNIELHFPNANVAIAWSFSSRGDPEVGCLIIGTLQVFWYANTHSRDLGQWLEHTIRVVRDDMSPKVVAGICMMIATTGLARSLDEQVTLLRKAWRYYDAAGDVAGAAYARSQLGGLLVDRDLNDAEGPQLLEEAYAQAEAVGAHLIARCTQHGLIYSAQMQQQDADAERILLDLIESSREANDEANLCRAIHTYGIQMMEQLKFGRALELMQESRDLAGGGVDMMFEMFSNCVIAELIRYLGDPAQAVMLCEEQLAFAHMNLGKGDGTMPMMIMAKALNDLNQQTRALPLAQKLLQDIHGRFGPEPTMLYHSLDMLACIASGSGNPIRAAQLFGVSDACLLKIKLRRWRYHDWEYAAYIAKARAALGDDAYDAAYAEGRTMPLEQAIAYALNDKMPDGYTASGI